jgi:hypothetical protein
MTTAVWTFWFILLRNGFTPPDLFGLETIPRRKLGLLPDAPEQPAAGQLAPPHRHQPHDLSGVAGWRHHSAGDAAAAGPTNTAEHPATKDSFKEDTLQSFQPSPSPTSPPEQPSRPAARRHRQLAPRAHRSTQPGATHRIPTRVLTGPRATRRGAFLRSPLAPQTHRSPTTRCGTPPTSPASPREQPAGLLTAHLPRDLPGPASCRHLPHEHTGAASSPQHTAH